MNANKHIIDSTYNELKKSSEADDDNYSKAKNTIIAYNKDFKDFVKFCKVYNKDPYAKDYECIKIYLHSLGRSNLKISTINRRLASIAHMYSEKNIEFNRSHYLITREIKNLKKKLGSSVTQKEALEPEQLDLIVNVINKKIKKNPNILNNYRDKALLSLLLYGGFRRSELSTLNIENVTKRNDYILIKLDKSKADQEGKNPGTAIYKNTQKEYIPYCPVRSYYNWIEIAKIKNGRIFRHIDITNKILPHNSISDKAIALIVKKRTKDAGFNPALFSGHSGRAGIVTALKRRGASNEEIKKITKQKSDSVVDSYDRRVEETENTLAKYLKR